MKNLWIILLLPLISVIAISVAVDVYAHRHTPPNKNATAPAQSPVSLFQRDEESGNVRLAPSPA